MREIHIFCNYENQLLRKINECSFCNGGKDHQKWVQLRPQQAQQAQLLQALRLQFQHL